MKLSFESSIVFNDAVGAVALWQFSRAYLDARNQAVGASLPEALLVLPIVFHRRSADAIHRMKQSSGLAKALLDEPELPAGLQRRLESFCDTSLSSLSLALASGLLQLDPDKPWPRYIPKLKSLPSGLQPSTDDVKQVVDAAKRLGWWIAHEDFNALCSMLQVRF